MARLARVVVPKYPHHVIQRGNRRQRTFFSPEDYRAYLDLMSDWCGEKGVDIWGYCLMPNHVHLIAVPETKDALRAAIGEAHRRYTRMINFREGWRGHLWQGRFASYVMEERYLLACIRYIEMNPVRSGLVNRAEKWPWSSARAHLLGKNDDLVNVEPLLRILGTPWEKVLGQGMDDEDVERLRRHERTGRPLGEPAFVEMLEAKTQLRLKPKRPGPKKRKTYVFGGHHTEFDLKSRNPESLRC